MSEIMKALASEFGSPYLTLSLPGPSISSDLVLAYVTWVQQQLCALLVFSSYSSFSLQSYSVFTENKNNLTLMKSGLWILSFFHRSCLWHCIWRSLPNTRFGHRSTDTLLEVYAFYIHAYDIVWTHIVTDIGILSKWTFWCDCIASAPCLRPVNHFDVGWPLGSSLCAAGFSFSSSPGFGLLLLCRTFRSRAVSALWLCCPSVLRELLWAFCLCHIRTALLLAAAKWFSGILADTALIPDHLGQMESWQYEILQSRGPI